MFLIVSGTQTGPIVKFKSVQHKVIGAIYRDFALIVKRAPFIIQQKARPEIRSGLRIYYDINQLGVGYLPPITIGLMTILGLVIST